MINEDLIKKCNTYKDLIIEMFGYDVSLKKRDSNSAYAKCVFYNVLTRKLGMKDINIQQYFEAIGISRDRSSVYHSLKKTRMYYDTSIDFRMMYDKFFDDLRINETDELKRKLKIKLLKKSVVKDELYNLLCKVPDERKQEIFDLVNLRIKSWEWKSKDSVKEYECGLTTVK